MPRNESETTKASKAASALIKAHARYNTLLTRKAKIEDQIAATRAEMEKHQATCHELGVPLKFE